MAQKAEFIQSDVITKLAELGNKIASDLEE
jgi:hypothetical protein